MEVGKWMSTVTIVATTFGKSFVRAVAKCFPFACANLAVCTVTIAYWIGICVICFMLGRVVQRWCDGTPNLECEIYALGYEAGKVDGLATRR